MSKEEKIAQLTAQVESGQYRPEADAVAEAIIQHAKGVAEMSQRPNLPLRVVITPEAPEVWTWRVIDRSLLASGMTATYDEAAAQAGLYLQQMSDPGKSDR